MAHLIVQTVFMNAKVFPKTVAKNWDNKTPSVGTIFLGIKLFCFQDRKLKLNFQHLFEKYYL